MSYSNGKLPDDTFSPEKVVEIVKGLPGVGFKLTDNGDYDMQNKKLRNLDSPQTNDDATTKRYVDSEVSKTLKLDGSNAMTGALNMDNRRVENIAPARHGQSDAVSSLQLHNFYFYLNTNDGKIEAQNPIDMKNQRILGVKDPILHSDASNKFYVDSSLNFKADKTQLSNKADKTELANYLKRDGLVSVTGDFDFGNNKISNLAEGTGNSDAVTKHQLQTGLSTKPNTNQVVLRNGTQEMTGDLDLSNNKIVNLKAATSGTHAVNLGQLNSKTAEYLPLKGAIMQGDIEMNSYTILGVRDENHDNAVASRKFVKDELNKKTDMNQVVLTNGTNQMQANLNMNNQRIINLGRATHNQDAITLKQVNDAFSTISTENNRYTDEQIEKNKKYVDDEILKSHITTHTNRKNVLKYAMDDGEFTEDYGIQDANLIDYNDSPHKNNKKAFSLKVQKATDGSSLFKGRFDFNLFKLIRDNYSDKYTVCLEIYFQKTGFDVEFNSFQVTFEKRNMNTDRTTTVKTNTDYKYYRFIMNLSPNGTSPNIERRLYVTVQSTYDNRSPTLLPLYVLIYGIKGEAKNNLDFTIYDYELAYQVVNNQFQMHVPINMNNNKMTGLALATNDDDAVSKKFFIDNLIQPRITYVTTRNPGSKWTMKYGHLNDRGQNLRFPKIRINAVTISYHNIPQGTYRLVISFGTGQTAFFQFTYKSIGVNYISINRTFVNVTEMSIRTPPGTSTGGYVVHFHGDIEFNPGA